MLSNNRKTGQAKLTKGAKTNEMVLICRKINKKVKKSPEIIQEVKNDYLSKSA